MRTLAAAIAMLALATLPASAQTAGASPQGGDSKGWRWEHWGADAGGTRFSPLTQITPGNVDNLVRAWEFHTGDLASHAPAAIARTKFEATPLFVEDSLILCSPF